MSTRAGVLAALILTGCGAPTPPPTPAPAPPSVAFAAPAEPYWKPAIPPEPAPPEPARATPAALRRHRDELAAGLATLDAALETAAFEAARARARCLALALWKGEPPEALPGPGDPTFLNRWLAGHHPDAPGWRGGNPLIDPGEDAVALDLDARLRLAHLPGHRDAIRAAIATLDAYLEWAAPAGAEAEVRLPGDVAEAASARFMLRPAEPGHLGGPAADLVDAICDELVARGADLAGPLPPRPGEWGRLGPSPGRVSLPGSRATVDRRWLAVRDWAGAHAARPGEHRLREQGLIPLDRLGWVDAAGLRPGDRFRALLRLHEAAEQVAAIAEAEGREEIRSATLR